jgi:hypothetical protein
MFLPLAPMAGAIPGAAPNDRQNRENGTPLVEEAIGEVTGVATVGHEIRALFSL